MLADGITFSLSMVYPEGDHGLEGKGKIVWYLDVFWFFSPRKLFLSVHKRKW